MQAKAKKLRGKAAIIGIGYAYTEEGDILKSPLRLIAEACREAILDAKMDKRNINGLLTQRPPTADLHPQYNSLISNELKIVPTFSTEITIHGAGISSAIRLATLAVYTGVADFVLCTTGDAGNIWVKDKVGTTALSEADRQFEAPYGPLTPSLYAQIAQRHMYEFGTTSAQLAKVAVEHRKWAVRHPYAGMRNEGLITIDDVLNSKMITSPLHLLDCAPRCRIGTAGAFIVASDEVAMEYTDKPIWILGFGEASTHEWITDRMGLSGVPPVEKGPNLIASGAEIAARDAYEISGVGPKDIDFVELTAPFTHCVVVLLEDFGFCKKGEGGKFIENGGIDFDGGLPVNTNGGLLSFGQVGAACTMDMIIEGIKQLRSEAPGKQVGGAEIGLIHGNGGIMACESLAILSNKKF